MQTCAGNSKLEGADCEVVLCVVAQALPHLRLPLADGDLEIPGPDTELLTHRLNLPSFISTIMIKTCFDVPTTEMRADHLSQSLA